MWQFKISVSLLFKLNCFILNRVQFFYQNYLKTEKAIKTYENVYKY